jgi:hypothetical protein
MLQLATVLEATEERLTMLDAVCTPLVLDHLREDARPAIEDFINDLSLRMILQVLESMLSPGQTDQVGISI